MSKNSRIEFSPGPYLVIGGHHDGERVDYDARFCELVRLSYSKEPTSAEVTFENDKQIFDAAIGFEIFRRHIFRVRRKITFVFAIEWMSEFDVFCRLIEAYPCVREENKNIADLRHLATTNARVSALPDAYEDATSTIEDLVSQIYDCVRVAADALKRPKDVIEDWSLLPEHERTKARLMEMLG